MEKDRGSLLITTLMVISVLAVLLVGASFVMIGGNRQTRLALLSLQAHYLAEAGVDYALDELKSNWSYTVTDYEVSFPKGNILGVFSLRITPHPEKKRIKVIQSEGRVSGHAKRITVEVERRSSLPAIFRNALASATDIDLAGSSHIKSSNPGKAKGNVYGHRRITLGGNVTVRGAVYSAMSGGILTRGSIHIEDGTFAGEDYRQEIPSVSESLRASWKDKARSGTQYSQGLRVSGNTTLQLNNTYINGDLDLTGNVDIVLGDDVVIYVKGKVKMTGNSSIRGQGIIVSEGVIHLTGKLSHVLNQPANIAFVSLSEGESKITGNGEVTGVFFVPRGRVKIAGNSSIFGSVVAHEIDFTGNAQITYNADLMDGDITWNPAKPLSMVRWEEN